MKILMISRLMTAFLGSVKTGVWKPSGSPAIYKLIEKLDASDDELELVFTETRRQESVLNYKYDAILKLQGLSSHITFLTGVDKIPVWFGKFREYISELRQAYKLLRLVWQLKPDLVYVDRSNVLAAGLIARIYRIPVVFRLLGVTPPMQDLLSKLALSHFIYRWAYRSSFRLVLCTREGSPAEAWMRRALSCKTEKRLWLNGADKVELPKKEKVNDKLQLLMLGRLDLMKRTHECIEAFLALPESVIGKVQLTIIGGGIFEKELRERVKGNSHEVCISFLGVMPHHKVNEYLINSDIYISLNEQGNLSNANLEAMRAGLCFILPEADPKTGIDSDTLNIIPDSAAIRIGLNDLVGNLKNALLHLINDPDEVFRRKLAMQKASEKLTSWNERIDREYQLLSHIASEKEFSNGIRDV